LRGHGQKCLTNNTLKKARYVSSEKPRKEPKKKELESLANAWANIDKF